MQKITGFFAVAALFLIFPACKPSVEKDVPALPAKASAPGCGEAGLLEARIYGAISATLDWSGRDLSCEGMPRPGGRGVRLRFSGSVEDHPLAIIVAMPEMARESAGAELASNVTLIEEGNGRFYSTADLDVCLAHIDAMHAVDDSGDRYSVSGSVYCVAPLVEINGEMSVSIPELHFTGRLDWSAS